MYSASDSRKRPRREDDESELKAIAIQQAKLPFPDLAFKIKHLESDDSDKETRERQRQIFGMVWLLNSCESSPTAVVPRNRIYARYVQICAEYSISPLSPASFGKLVRILFPHLTTRRLGMRGQSKYHYCGIKLAGDQKNFQADLVSPGSTSSGSAGVDSPHSSLANSPPPVSDFQFTGTDDLQVVSLIYIPNLFPLIESSLSLENMNSPLNLPSIYPFLPKDTDLDIADTLFSLYKVHCTAIFEGLRYMHVKKLFYSFSTFNSILTAPVFKLYTSESVLEWVQQCDLIMYRTMAKMLTKLHLQNVPDEVLLQLKYISKEFVPRLANSLQAKVPKAFLLMKVKDASHFITILSRLIKVIETGQFSLKILNNPNEKQTMIEDWRKLNLEEIVLREVPCSKINVDILLPLMKQEVIDALQHENSDQYIASFLAELPSRFSTVKPWFFLLVTSNLITTCLREISLQGGQGFGAWWIFRCWVDEYLNWCFELGGFLQEEFQFKPPIKLEDTAEEDNIDNSEQLRSASMVDLLDGAYGRDDSQNHDFLYENVNVNIEFPDILT